MRLKNLALSLGLIAATAFVTATVVSQEQPDGQMPEWMTPEAMARMTPNEHHEKLAQFVGTWHQDMKFWESPGAEPSAMSGTSTYTWLIEGRYLKGKYEANFGGMPFVGYEIMGYDNMKQEYFSIWFDNFGTGYMISTGQLKGDTMSMSGTSDDPMTGEKGIKMRSVGKIVDDNTMTFEMFRSSDGAEFKNMESTSTRIKK
jgi:hypothetical protein